MVSTESVATKWELAARIVMAASFPSIYPTEQSA